MKPVKISNLLLRQKKAIIVIDEEIYKRVTIRTRNQGVKLRSINKGIEIGTKKQFVINKGQFLLSKIDARYGALGIVPNELDGAIITGNFWAYEVDDNKLNIEWFNMYTSSPNFIKICDQASSGTTNRRYLDEKKFLGHEILLPDIGEQIRLVEKYKSSKEKYSKLDGEIENQVIILSRIRQSILHEAVQGKLIPQDPNDEPVSVLLEKIKVEKDQLIKEKKIKKEKPLPEIIEDEIPYELPQGWEWIRLGSVLHSTYNGIYKPDHFYSDDGVVSLRMYNIQNGKIVYNDLTRMSLTDEEKLAYKLVPGDILLNRVNSKELVGKSAIIEEYIEDLVYESMNMRLRFIESSELPKYINKYLLTNMVREIINGFSKQAISQASINQGQIRDILIPLPPLKEQKRIVDKVDQLMTLCDELEQTVNQSKQESKMLMQAVLQEAFSITEKDNNVVKLPLAIPTDIEDWEIAARSDGEIDLETKAKIKNRVTELLGKSKQ